MQWRIQSLFGQNSVTNYNKSLNKTMLSCSHQQILTPWNISYNMQIILLLLF